LTETSSWKWRLAQTLEYKWWQNYLHKQDADAYLEWKANYWQDILQTISTYIPLPYEKTILDAGCGPAGIFISLEGNSVDALDPLLDKYTSLEHFQPARFPYTTFINTPLEAWKPLRKYDYIFCMNAINHVNDIDACYDNLAGALKQGGYLVISTDAHRYNILKKVFQYLPGDALHPVQLSIEEYDEKLVSRGMQIIKNILYKEEKIFNYFITIARK
jgi:2-polyprenyl-6-hydroxyphenyl methylase/3-demethylubiquinone-9 3-methyltransferase